MIGGAEELQIEFEEEDNEGYEVNEVIEWMLESKLYGLQ